MGGIRLPSAANIMFMLLGGIAGAVLAVAVVAEDRSSHLSPPPLRHDAQSERGPSPEPGLLAAGSPKHVSSAGKDSHPKSENPKPDVVMPKGVVMRSADVPEAPPEAEAVASMLPPGLKKAREIDKQYNLFGDRTKYGYRVQLFDSRGYSFARSGLKRQMGRTVPDAWVPFVLKLAGIEVTPEELAEYVERGWDIWKEESRLVGALAKRTQALIDRRMKAADPDEGIAAIEVRDGKVYIVRSSDDIEVRTIMETLRGLDERRRGFARRIAEER